MNRMNRATPYSNTVSIIQSSGTGKSRMVDQLGHLVFTIPINIRAESDDRGVAFPPPDLVVSQFMKNPPCATANEVGVYYLLFLKCIFEGAQSCLQNCITSSHAGVAKFWYSYLRLGDNRERFYEAVVESARKDWVQLQARDRKDVEVREAALDQ